MTAIVDVLVTQTIAPTPPTLQKTGALISQGATTTSPGTLSLLTQLSDLAPLLVGARALSTLTWSGGIVTATASAPHGYDVGDTIELTIAGCTPTGYNGTYLCTITGANTLTYVRTNPGSLTVPGTYTPDDVAELNAMATTFFTQGSSVAVYVLEVGAGTIADGVAALSSYLTNNPETLYGILVPRAWDAEPDFLALIADYEATTSKLYFWVTTTLQTRGVYTDLMKDVFALVEAPQQNIFQGNTITAFTYSGESIATAAAVVSPGSGSVAPGALMTVVGGVGDPPILAVQSTQVIAATVVSGGTSGTDGSVTITGTTGTGTKFQATGTISGGALTGALTVVTNGSYTVNPTNLTAEPVTGGGLAGATVSLSMGVNGVSISDPGGMHTLPDNPVSTTGGAGATVNITWQQDALTGEITASTATAHGVSPGDLFQLAGMVPAAYNTYYKALPGTSGSTLFAAMYAAPGPATVLGSLLPSTVVSAAPPSTEFTVAAPFWNALHIDPSSTNKVAPFAFQFVFGVTNWVQKGNGAILQALQNEGINAIKSGAEGGISNSCIFWGTVRQTPRDLTYWYSIDWLQLNAHLNLANAIINGSNNPINPLYYDQNGIDRLQDVVMSTVQTAVSYGLANGVPTRTTLTASKFIDALENGTYAGKLVVNAEPLRDYLTNNPNDYKIGRYAGLSVGFIPNRGFIHVLFNINVTDFLAA